MPDSACSLPPFAEGREGSWGIINAEAIATLKALDANSVDLIATDPPYFKVKNEPWDRQWDKPEQFLAWLDTILEQFHRVLKPNGSLYLFASPRMAARVEVLIGKRFNVLNQIAWGKPRSRANHYSKETLRCFFGSSERIIFAEHYGADNIAKGEAGYGAKCDELRGFVFEPLRAYLAGERDRAGWTTRRVAEAFQRKTGSRTVTGMAGHWFKQVQWWLPNSENYQWLRDLFNYAGGDYLKRKHDDLAREYDGLKRKYDDLKREYDDLKREYDDLKREYEALRRPFSVTADDQYTDVWSFKTVGHYKGKHPCEKPLPLMRQIVNASSREGALVLDPFMGSGTTGVAAVELGRKFIGIDMSEKWCARANERIREAESSLF